MNYSSAVALAFAFSASCAVEAYAADPFILDNQALDTVVAGRAITGIEATASVPAQIGDTFLNSGAKGEFFPGDDSFALSAETSCDGLGCGDFMFLGTFAVAAPNVRQVIEESGSDLPQPDGTSLAAYSLLDLGIDEIEVVAFGPTGGADARVRVFPIAQNDFVSATIGIGRGRASGDGQVGVTGVIGEGQGVGQGYAIQTPSGDQLLVGVAVAVDPSAFGVVR